MDDSKKLNYINFALDRAYDIFDDLRDMSLMAEKLRNRINEFYLRQYDGLNTEYIDHDDNEREDIPFLDDEFREATKELYDTCDGTLNSAKHAMSTVLDQVTQATGLFSNTVHVLNDMYEKEYEAFQKKEGEKKNARNSQA